MSTQQRVAVVTGGARGIGAATARRLAKDGHAVAVIDLDPRAGDAVAAEIADDGGKALFVEADITHADAVTQAFDAVVAQLGAPTILVNNAGITRDNLLFRMTNDDWDDVVRVHLRGAFLMTRAAQVHMTAANWGRIVNLSSVAALGNRGQSNYSAAKAGLQGLTKTNAIELGKFGITVNSIAPGFIATEMTVATAERLGVTFDDFKADVAKRIPVGRVGEPDDIASLVSFLCGDESGFVSGQVIYVAGGPRV